MSKARVFAGVGAALVVAGAVAAFAIAWRPALPATDPSSPQSFDPDLIKHGRELAALGNCSTCHTRRGGSDFAGGLPVPTPFGTIYSSNITPDADTGIGRWPEDAFRRAMRSGVDRDGRHLYPTFPYDHFTHVSDEDDRALYAFLMTRQPVHAVARLNQLPFPLDQRVVIAGWKLLFLRRDGYLPDPAKSAEWNRGAYLVEGLAHCGACHTPRNALGAERASASFAGGDADNWSAYAINAQSPAPVPWTEEALFNYLRQRLRSRSRHRARADGRGRRQSLRGAGQRCPRDCDLYGRRVRPAGAGPQAPGGGRAGAGQVVHRVACCAGAQANPAGAAIYAAACATCHESERPLPYGGVNLALSTALSSPDPRNAANIVLSGVRPVEGERSPIMPGFAASMSDGQIAALLNCLRARFGKQPAWAAVEQTVARRAAAARPCFSRPRRESQNPPADGSQRDKP